MLACIPTLGGAGLDDAVSDHFGSAPFFVLFDTDSGQLSVVENLNAHHSHGTCHPMTALSRHRIGAVICRGMGRRAVETMNAQNIRIYRTRARTVADVVEEIRTGQLREMTAREACAGHDGRRTRAGDRKTTAGFGPGHGSSGESGRSGARSGNHKRG